MPPAAGVAAPRPRGFFSRLLQRLLGDRDEVLKPGGDGKVIPGDVPDLAETKLQEASADLLVKREQYGRDATTALIGQVATVGTFLGAFSLLNDSAKAAVVQSPWSLWVLVAAAVSLGFSLSTYFALPAKMPSLNQPESLRDFWNDRVRTRRALLSCALVALGAATFFAAEAFADARDAVAPQPAGSVSGKFTPAKDTPSSLEASATWSGLESGDLAILCVVGPGTNGKVLGGALGAAADDGKQTLTLTVPVPTATKGEVTVTTVQLASAPGEGTTATSTCSLDKPARVGQPVSGSIAVG